MKNKMIKFFSLALLSLFTFSNISCGGTFVKKEFFFIELYDENNKIITKKEELEEFVISQTDNYTGKKFDGEVWLAPYKYDDSSDGSYIYILFFHLGTGHFETTAERYERRFNKQMEKTGIRIVDKNGKYKPCEIYPLSDYKTGCKTDKYASYHTTVKLEKK